MTFSPNPIGAEIYIDGKFVGQTPSTISMPPGPHVVVVKAPGRRNWQRDLEVLKDSQVALHPVLELQASSAFSPDRLIGTCDVHLRAHSSSAGECERLFEIASSSGTRRILSDTPSTTIPIVVAIERSNNAPKGRCQDIRISSHANQFVANETCGDGRSRHLAEKDGRRACSWFLVRRLSRTNSTIV